MIRDADEISEHFRPSRSACAGLACAAPAPKPAATPAAVAAVAAARPPPAPAADGAPPAPAPRITPDAPFREQAPAAGPEQPYHPPHWTRFKLKNGLEVFLVEFHDLPLVDFNLVVKTGSAANPADKAGLADLTARMLVEGTKTRGALEIADQVAALGATLVTGSSWEASSAGLSTLTKNLDAALAIFGDVVQNPAFDAKEFARVRDNLLTAIARRKDSPPTVAGLALAHLLYGAKHPYALADDGHRGDAQEGDAGRPARVLGGQLPPQQRRPDRRGRRFGSGPSGQAGDGVQGMAREARRRAQAAGGRPRPPRPRSS